MRDFNLPLITKQNLKLPSLSNICLPIGVHKNQKGGGLVLFLSLGILPFLLLVGSCDNVSPELDTFVLKNIGKNDLWAATHTVVRDRGQAKPQHLQLATPFLSECLPPAQQAWLNGSWAHLQATGVYGLAWSLAVWSWFHEASSFASCRRVIISKRGTECTAEGSNYLSCHHLFHHQACVNTLQERQK